MTIQDPPAPVLSKTLIPQDLHERGWAKPWLEKPWTPETAAEVFKKLDGAEALIGKKRGIPENDDPEAWKEFHSKLRPGKADDYELVLGEKPDANFVKAFRDAAFEAGASKHTVKVLTEKLTPHFQAAAKAQADAETARDAAFETMLKSAVGPEHEKKTARVQAALKELAPEGAKQFIDKMDDKSLVLVVAFADALLTKYAGEDDFSGKGGSSGAGGTDKEALIKELHALYASDGWKDFRHADRPKTEARVNEILASPAFK